MLQHQLMKSLFIRFIVILACLFLSFESWAQVDKEFWFAAPDINGNIITGPNADRPIILRVSANTEDADIIISQPANPSFVPITAKLFANTTQNFNLTNFINSIEHGEVNGVLSNGLFIQSSSPVSCYYDIVNNRSVDIFNLKGRNALGKKFTVPFQMEFNNRNNSVEAATNTNDFVIIASEDSTLVTIQAKNDLIGYPAGSSHQIMLNRGQTYMCRAASNEPSLRPGGTNVLANKPISITVKEDLLLYPGGGCADVGGDQLIPDNLAGREYIIMKGRFSNNNPDYFYIFSTEDNTTIKINGNSLPINLNSAEYYTGILSDESIYVETNVPVQLYHISGFGCEVGASVIPPIKCTGSSRISVSRASVNETFFINILAPRDIINEFLVNNSTTELPASLFVPVVGNPQWMVAKTTINSTFAGTDGSIIIENKSGKFHAGVIQGGTNNTTRYGYFTDFSKTSIKFENKFSSFCIGAPVSKSPILIVGASDPIGYQWYRNANPSNTGGTAIQGATDSAYTVPLIDNTVGTTYYYVEVQGVCGNVTSPVTPIIITPNTIVNASLSQPANICLGDSIPVLQVNATGEGTLAYQWYINSTNSITGATAIAGATTPTYTPDSLRTGSSFYFAQVLGTCGGDTTAIIRLNVDDCSVVCTYPKDYFGDDDDDDDDKDDDKKKNNNRSELIKNALTKWQTQEKGLVLGGKDRFVRINSYSREIKLIQEFLDNDGKYSNRISAKFSSLGQMVSAKKDKENALLQETLTLALNMGLNWNWQFRAIDSAILFDKLKMYCKECNYEEDDDKDHEKDDDKKENYRYNITRSKSKCLPASIEDWNKDDKITPRDIFMIANDILNGNERFRTEANEIKNLICAINHHYSCKKRKHDDDDEKDKKKNNQDNTHILEPTTVKTSPNPFSSKLNFALIPTEKGQFKIELFDQFNRKINEKIILVTVPNQTYTIPFTFTSNSMNKIIYKISKGNWSKSGWVLKQ